MEMNDSVEPNPLPKMAPPQPQPDAEVLQEQLLKAKYGGLLPKKKLAPRDHKYFDSADWQMGKQKGGSATPKLQPKLEPSLPAPRRSSQLGDSQ
ncbi:hypothetical protein Ndes2526B_g03143 [Nannochloris sp. 'desiccata']|nr:hypothetical protein KSW81_006623 [Chlorella desiccata (nom. nud.)]